MIFIFLFSLSPFMLDLWCFWFNNWPDYIQEVSALSEIRSGLCTSDWLKRIVHQGLYTKLTIQLNWDNLLSFVAKVSLIKDLRLQIELGYRLHLVVSQRKAGKTKKKKKKKKSPCHNLLVKMSYKLFPSNPNQEGYYVCNC